MKLVIEIPEEVYERTRTIPALGLVDYEVVKDSVAKGTELKQSVWVGIDDEPHEDWECGNCGFLLEAMDYPEIKQMHYCPGCGAEMVGATDA